MIIIKSHKKVLIEELCEKYIAELFSDEEMDEETIVKVEGMIKDGVDLLFDNEVQTNVFRMDHRMSQTAEQMLGAFWLKLAKRYSDIGMYKRQYVVVVQELHAVDPSGANKYLNENAQQLLDSVIEARLKTDSSIIDTEAGKQIVTIKNCLLKSQNGGQQYIRELECLQLDSPSMTEATQAHKKTLNFLFNLVELAAHNQSNNQIQSKMADSKAISSQTTHQSVGKTLTDLITLDKISDNLFINLVLKEVHMILCTQPATFDVNDQLNKAVVDYLLKMVNKIEDRRQRSPACVQEHIYQMCEDVAEALQFYI